MVTSGEGWKEGIISEPGMDMYTLLYLKWITSKVLLYSTGNSNVIGQPGSEGKLGKNGYMYMYG